MRWLGSLLLLVLLAGQGQAQPFTFDPPPTPITTAWFEIIDGQLAWRMSGPDPSYKGFAQEFWKQRRLAVYRWSPLYPRKDAIVWQLSPAATLRFDEIDEEHEQMRCLSDLPLADSARAILEALGCIWDSS